VYDFLEKLINISLPRVRDFRGISGKAFDGRGNYTLGIKEQIIFPEMSTYFSCEKQFAAIKANKNKQVSFFFIKTKNV